MNAKLIFMAGIALALPTFAGHAQDPSARTVEYHSRDIISIHGKLKYTTLIVLPATEKIMEAATGRQGILDRRRGRQLLLRTAGPR
jgi:type IV secretory pathway VirB9-like protein